MTRKRYVKLLMGAGVERNVANANAAVVRQVGWSYQDYFVEVMQRIVEDAE